MGESKDGKKEKGQWVEGLKSEFGKIIWLNKVDLGKQTLAVVIVSVILGIIIALLDSGVQHGMDFLVKL